MGVLVDWGLALGFVAVDRMPSCIVGVLDALDRGFRFRVVRGVFSVFADLSVPAMALLGLRPGLSGDGLANS